MTRLSSEVKGHKGAVNVENVVEGARADDVVSSSEDMKSKVKF